MRPSQASLSGLRSSCTGSRCNYQPFTPRRFNARLSSVPERTRKLPFTGRPWTIKRWQRSFLLGILVGAITTGLWSYYDDGRSRTSFVVYTLVRKEPVSSTASIFHLAPASKTADFETYKQAWRQGIWNFHFKQPQIQIVRAYTPLPPVHGSSSDGDGTLRFLIRRDPDGEVSNYLHSLPVGASTELRGPNLEYAIPEDVKQVLFFAGGTGIAPALQVAHAMFDNAEGSDDKKSATAKRLHILWANRRREDCVGGDEVVSSRGITDKGWGLWGLFAKQGDTAGAKPPTVPEAGPVACELRSLAKAYPGQITIQYFVNEEETFINGKAVGQALQVFDDKPLSDAAGDPRAKEQRQIIISGPPGFIAHLAGPKEWRNGTEEQGQVSRLLAHSLSKNPHNVKIWKV